ncbi:hypothetical protein HDU76_013145 [Blyttiomyces sp. JEL0837]|nr:hypothetical protein HDU76_013145 [Blyttiomyces sp. JEL0837]
MQITTLHMLHLIITLFTLTANATPIDQSSNAGDDNFPQFPAGMFGNAPPAAGSMESASASVSVPSGAFGNAPPSPSSISVTVQSGVFGNSPPSTTLTDIAGPSSNGVGATDSAMDTGNAGSMSMTMTGSGSGNGNGNMTNTNMPMTTMTGSAGGSSRGDMMNGTSTKMGGSMSMSMSKVTYSSATVVSKTLSTSQPPLIPLQNGAVGGLIGQSWVVGLIMALVFGYLF